MKFWYLIPLSVLTAGKTFAQTAFGDTLQAPNPASYTPSLFGIMVKLVLSMVIIVGLIYLSMFLLKKMNSRTAGGGVGDAIRVLGRTFISPKQCLYVVKIGERYSVLGATESNINLIAELSKEEAEKFDKQSAKGAAVPGMMKFGDIFKGKLRP